MFHLGDVVRKLREEQDWKQIELGHRAGIDKGTVVRLEKRPDGVTADTIAKVARAFGMMPADLYGRVPRGPDTPSLGPEMPSTGIASTPLFAQLLDRLQRRASDKPQTDAGIGETQPGTITTLGHESNVWHISRSFAGDLHKLTGVARTCRVSVHGLVAALLAELTGRATTVAQLEEIVASVDLLRPTGVLSSPLPAAKEPDDVVSPAEGRLTAELARLTEERDRALSQLERVRAAITELTALLYDARLAAGLDRPRETEPGARRNDRKVRSE